METARHPPDTPGRTAQLAMVLLATAISVAAQGFRYGHANNAYHIPIVLDLPSLPQFAADPFYGTLDRYASAVYPVLGLVATESNVAAVFFAAHIVTRALTLCVLLILALRLVPLPTVVAAVYVVALGITPALLGVSPIGQHEMMPLYFTHSALVLPLATGAFLAAAARHRVLAGVLGGVTFCVNAFAGVWTAIVLGATMVTGWQRQRPARMLQDLSVVAAAFVAAALPVLWWLVSSGVVGGESAVAFDFRAYLSEYYRLHTWILGRDPAGYARFIQVTGLAVVVFACCRVPRAIVASYGACAAVFLVGVMLPYVTAQRLLLNLYPLRADALLTYMGVGVLLPGIAHLARGERGFTQPHPVSRAGAGANVTPSRVSWLPARATVPWLAIALVGLATGSLISVGSVLSVLLLRSGRRSMALVAAVSAALPLLVGPGSTASLGAPGIGFAATLLAGLALLNLHSGAPALHAVSGLLVADVMLGGLTRAMVVAILTVAVLVVEGRNGSFRATRTEQKRPMRQHSIPVATLLLCALVALCAVRSARRQSYHLQAIERSREAQVATAAWARAAAHPHALFLVPAYWSEFQWRSQRRVWIDWKQGAAPMWAPEFYPVWVSRYPPVAALHSAAEIVAYGCTQPVDYIVVLGSPEHYHGAIFRSRTATVLDAAQACGAR